MKYNREVVLNMYNTRGTKVIPFYGHKVTSDITVSCLSNWYPAQFDVNGVHYTCTEQYMMAEKARLFEDNVTLNKILDAKEPREMKKLGRLVKNFDKDTWDKHKEEIMYTGVYNKFKSNKSLKEFLLSTGDSILVEASPRDRIWGVGMGLSNPNVYDPNLWRGRNLLGIALMNARDTILNDEKGV